MSGSDDELSAYDDENEFWDCALPSKESGWTLVATCVDGQVTWEDGWDSTYRAVHSLSFLAELEDGQPDWDSLLSDLPHLQALKGSEMGFPPLVDLRDFPMIGDMYMVFQGDGDYGTATALYIDEQEHAVVGALTAEFEALADRLKAYPPLQSYADDM